MVPKFEVPGPGPIKSFPLEWEIPLKYISDDGDLLGDFVGKKKGVR